MRFVFLYGILFFLSLSAFPQQHPLYTHHIFNDYGINPAFGGTGECLDFRAGGRLQWVGFEGNPQTAFFNAHGRISPKVSNGREWFMGVGGRLVNDIVGPFSSFRLELSWSIHIKLGRKMYASLGLFSGFVQSSINPNLLEFGGPDPLDPSNRSIFAAPTITPGFLLYTKDFFIGLTLQDVIPRPLADVSPETNMSTHYILKTSRNFKLSDRASLLPSIAMRMVEAAPVAFELSLLYQLDEKYQIGMAYRNETALSALLKIRLFSSFSVAYAYDFIINDISLSTSGSHEVTIGFNTCRLDEGQATRCAAFN